MNSSSITKRDIVKTIIFAGVIIFFIVISQINDKQTKIFFCDVGQGDAAYIRIKNQVDVLIDAGPDKKVLNCVGRYMPFWDRKIELVIISHPQKDHFGGLLSLIDRYQIEKIFFTQVDNQNQTFQRLKEKIDIKKIPVYYPTAGTKVKISDSQLIFYWPTEEFIKNKIASDLNDYSLVFVFIQNHFKILFTGDASPLVFYRLLNQSKDNLANLKKINILKIPHHGSRNGLIKEFLQLADPPVAVISVGKNNPYGHPHRQILEMLKAQKVQIRRTDVEGDIVFKLKTQSLKLKTNK
jgi:competence protein ComEC